MTQSQLKRAVADRTGEALQTIRARGFSLLSPLKIYDPDADEVSPPPGRGLGSARNTSLCPSCVSAALGVYTRSRSRSAADGERRAIANSGQEYQL